MERLTEEQVVKQFEQMAHQFAWKNFVPGLDHEAIAQGMRAEAVRALRDFDPSKKRNISTLVHTYMETRVKNLRNGSNQDKRKANNSTVSIDATSSDTDGKQKPRKYLPDEVHEDKPMEWDFLKSYYLTSGEMIILDLKMCGYSWTDIRQMCEDEQQFWKVKKTLQKKIKNTI